PICDSATIPVCAPSVLAWPSHLSAGENADWSGSARANSRRARVVLRRGGAGRDHPRSSGVFVSRFRPLPRWLCESPHSLGLETSSEHAASGGLRALLIEGRWFLFPRAACGEFHSAHQARSTRVRSA